MPSSWTNLRYTVPLVFSLMEDFSASDKCLNMSCRPEAHNITNLQDKDTISMSDLKKVSFIFGTVLIPIVSLFGTVGNVLSLCVLFHGRMRHASNACLAALSISDLAFLMHSLVFAAMNIVSISNKELGAYYRAILFPSLGAYGSPATARITSWLTLLLGVERFIAVYFPLRAKVICSKLSSVTVIIIIYVSTFLLFLPYALKYQVVYKNVNTSVIMTSSAKLQLSELGQNKRFFCVYGMIMNILFRFLPVIILIVLNAMIILVSRNTWKIRREMRNNSYGSTLGSHDQIHFTVMLVTVCIIFLICLIPGAIHSLISHTWKEYNREGAAKNLYLCVSGITFFLETLNSSANFVIYMVMSKKFKQTYKAIFCCQKGALHSGNSLNSHSKDISPLMDCKRGRAYPYDRKTCSSIVTRKTSYESCRKISRESMKSS